MAQRMISCRVCGKSFVPCNKTSNMIGAFNYRSISCSPECGAEYLRRVQAARQNAVVDQNVPDAIVSMDETTISAYSDEPTVERTVRGKRRSAMIYEEKVDILSE